MTVAQTGYLSVAEFQLLTAMPQQDVDALEVAEPGYIQTRLNIRSRWMDARLRKRYVVPFASPYPEIVKLWLSALVTPEAYGKRGWSPASKSDEEAIIGPAREAMTEIKESADSMAGLFELPVLDAADSDAVSKAAPMSYSEQSPYVWATSQADAGREEDSQ